MLNEAKMAYLGGRQDAHPSSQPWLALACDVGGFSMDIALLYVKPTTGSIDVLAKRSDSLYIGDGWLVSDIVDDIMFGATDDKPVPMDSESLVRFFVEQYFTALYLGEEPKSEYISSGDRKPRIQFGHVIERYRKKQIEDVRACIRKLLRRVEGVAELVVTGGGAQDWGLVDAINEVSGSALAPGVRAHVAPRPSPEWVIAST
ncbi:hypothetical protein BKA63DRAFT_526940 [Paraphoma chrysanthemicola]|nr:hypothetical protein BKA63DRAFT_526940 [Paraphoma chrysanthemicola]